MFSYAKYDNKNKMFNFYILENPQHDYIPWKKERKKGKIEGKKIAEVIVKKKTTGPRCSRLC